jgi:membrane complex biogenesis BtpA family protein
MSLASELLPGPGCLIGMLHLGALPGTPGHSEPLASIVERAALEARLLAEVGFDALLVENMGDRPYLLRRVGPEIVASMTAATLAVRAAAPDLPLGVQVLAGDNAAALAVAQAAGADFIRAEGFAFAAVADEGFLAEASAGPLLRFRRVLGAERVAILCDIQKKHSSHAITADLSLADHARAAEFCGADGLIVTGRATGEPTSPEHLRQAAEAVDLPVFVGSGVTPLRVPQFLPQAAGFIVGSYLKRDGRWDQPLDRARCEELVSATLLARR